jgi:hypothetical protein
MIPKLNFQKTPFVQVTKQVNNFSLRKKKKQQALEKWII